MFDFTIAPVKPGEMSAGWRVSTNNLRGDLWFVQWSYYGFWWHKYAMYAGKPQSPVFTNVGIPFWFLFLISAPLPAIRLRAFWKKRKAVPHGHCPACGYDMRASPSRCPECGGVTDVIEVVSE